MRRIILTLLAALGAGIALSACGAPVADAGPGTASIAVIAAR